MEAVVSRAAPWGPEAEPAEASIMGPFLAKSPKVPA